MAGWPPARLLRRGRASGRPARALSGAKAQAASACSSGPEGGFDDGERAAILAAPGVLRLSLGPRVLRADTAAVAALALVQAAIGDWRLRAHDPG